MSRRSRSRTLIRSSKPHITPMPAANAVQPPPADGELKARYVADLQRIRAERIAPHSLARAWGDWLDPLPFDWFVTLTFPVQVHPEQAHKRWRRWIRALEHHPKRPAGIDLIWARADEQQRRQVIHFHALIALVGSVPIFSAGKLWERIGGGWAHIRPYQSGLGGAYYISKGGDVELSSVWFDS